MRTSIVRLTAAPKRREGVISDPADGLELAGGPQRPPAVPPEAAFSQITHITSLLTVGFQRRCPLGHGGEQRPLIEETTMRAPHGSGTGSGQARERSPTGSKSRANTNLRDATAASGRGVVPC
jgi:hypothetical protein